MAGENVDRDQQTEEATPRKLAKAREEGNFPKSPDIASAGIMLGTVGLFFFMGDEMFLGLLEMVTSMLGTLEQGVRVDRLTPAASHVAGFVGPIALLSATVAISAGVAQSGALISFTPITPDLKKIDPIKKFKQMFLSLDGFIEVFKALFKFAVVGVIAVTYLTMTLPVFLDSPPATATEGAVRIGELILGLVLRIAGAFVVVAFLDFALQKWQFARNQKMTKQQVKDEHKDTEGDPQIRGRRRQKHRELMSGKMIADVAQADVVVVNPTQFAVALKYDAGSMSAPRVVAKGRKFLAQKIRDAARAAGVPIVAQPPLARLLYHTAKVGSEIPVEAFRVVAELLAYVYRLRKDRANSQPRRRAA